MVGVGARGGAGDLLQLVHGHLPAHPHREQGHVRQLQGHQVHHHGDAVVVLAVRDEHGHLGGVRPSLAEHLPTENMVWVKLQALVYDILPSTAAVFSYAIGSRKLSAYEQFFVGAQTVVSSLQTTQNMPSVRFITDHVAYVSSNKIKIVSIETELFSDFVSVEGGGRGGN